jgi:hypothetical protein
MKLIDQILRKPLHVAFGQALQGGGITSVDLVATPGAATVTITASDGSAAPIAGADASTAGVMTAADKIKLDGLSNATTQDFPTGLEVAAAAIPADVTHIRTADHSIAGDGGGALYKRVASAPTHNLKVQSTDGAWWELVPTSNIVPFQTCGGIEGDDPANGAANVAAFNDFIGYAQAFFTNLITADGPTLQFPKGHYHFNTHLNVKAAVRIQGAGTYGEGTRTGTVLHFPAGSNGIIVQNATTIDDKTSVSTFTGTHAIIEGLHLIGGGFGGTTGHGVWLRASATVQNCFVTQFGQDGVHIAANVGSGGATEGNANQWTVDSVLAKRNGRHGLYVDDADANAGYCEQFDATLNARWGIYDSSLIGNTYIACHAASNGLAGNAGNAADQSSYVSSGGNLYSASAEATEAQLVATAPGTDPAVWILKGTGGVGSTTPLWVAAKPEGTYFHGGSYRTDGVGAANVFMGCYREEDQAENQILAPSMIIGGTMTVNRSSGLAILGLTTGAKMGGQVSFSNSDTFPKTATRSIELSINRGYEKALRLDVDSQFMTLLAWDEADDAYLIGEVNNSTASRPIAITGTASSASFGGRSTALGSGEVVFGKGLFVGDHRFNARHLTNGLAAPTTGAHARGELVWNRNAAAGAPLGWACTATGTPGTWVEIRGVANQTAGANQTAIVNSTGGTRDGTLAAVGDTTTVNQAAALNNNFTDLHTLLNEVRTTLINFGMMKGGV